MTGFFIVFNIVKSAQNEYICRLNLKIMGRPTKLTDRFLRAFREVVDDLTVIALTDEEILAEINDKLDPADRIARDSFFKFKSGELETDEARDFFDLYKKALAKEKRNLLKRLQAEEKGWQRFAWILERKFNEFNLKQSTEVKLTTDPIVIKINLGAD